jgi:hypothetical protein
MFLKPFTNILQPFLSLDCFRRQKVAHNQKKIVLRFEIFIFIF